MSPTDHVALSGSVAKSEISKIMDAFDLRYPSIEQFCERINKLRNAADGSQINLPSRQILCVLDEFSGNSLEAEKAIRLRFSLIGIVDPRSTEGRPIRKESDPAISTQADASGVTKPLPRPHGRRVHVSGSSTNSVATDHGMVATKANAQGGSNKPRRVSRALAVGKLVKRKPLGHVAIESNVAGNGTVVDFLLQTPDSLRRPAWGFVSDTVNDLKGRLLQEYPSLGTGVTLQLTFLGKVLENGSTLKEYGVRSKAVVSCSFLLCLQTEACPVHSTGIQS